MQNFVFLLKIFSNRRATALCFGTQKREERNIDWHGQYFQTFKTLNNLSEIMCNLSAKNFNFYSITIIAAFCHPCLLKQYRFHRVINHMLATCVFKCNANHYMHNTIFSLSTAFSEDIKAL